MMSGNNKEILRGDVLLVDFDPVIGSEQGKRRPALVIQNDLGNKYSPITIVAAITSRTFLKAYPTNLEIHPRFLPQASTIMLNQVRTIDKSRIHKVYGHLDTMTMQNVDDCLKKSLGLA